MSVVMTGARTDQVGPCGATAPHWAAQQGSEDALALLLQSPSVAIDARSVTGSATALHWAAASDQKTSAQILIAAGADTTLRNAVGHTPLAVAAATGQMSALEVLMQHSTAAALVATAAVVHSNAPLDATNKQAVVYELARKAADKDPAAAAAAASAHAAQQDLVQIFLRAQGTAGKAKDQVTAAAEVTNIQQERAAVQHLIVAVAGLSKRLLRPAADGSLRGQLEWTFHSCSSSGLLHDSSRSRAMRVFRMARECSRMSAEEAT